MIELLTVAAIATMAVLIGWFIGAAVLALVYGVVRWRMSTRQEIK